MNRVLKWTIAVIRVGTVYYMSSTTMHMGPGLPIVKSKDLVDWTLVGYTLPHFMGYRFGPFNFATKTAGGFVDFDFFRVSDEIREE